MTDGSVARITTGGVAASAVTTTRLLGGTTNVWNSSDRWVLDPFVVTFETITTSAYGVQSTTKQEEALIIGRSTDTLTVATSGRGYNGSTANTFVTGDYVRLNVTAPIHERVKDILSVMGQQQDTDRTTLATAGTNITNLQTGSYHYVVATGSANAYVVATPALAAYAAGNIVRFKANFTNSGAATVNVNSLGAQAIKKLDGATALASGDIVNGQILTVVYDGTNFQLASPIGQVAAIDVDVLNSNTTDSSAAGTSTAAEANFDRTYTIPTTAWGAGNVLRVTAVVRAVANNSDNFIVRLKIGSTTLLTSQTLTNQVAGVRATTVIMEAYIACIDVSATGHITYWGWFINAKGNSSTDFQTAGQTEELYADDLNAGGTSTDATTQTTTLDMTTTQTLQLSIDYGGSSINNAARLQRLIVEKLAVN